MTLQNKRLQTSDVIIFGASGHAKVVIDIIEKQGTYRVVGLIDDNPNLKNSNVYDYKVLGGKSELSVQGCNQCLIAIGDNYTRLEIAKWAEETGLRLSKAAIHPSSQLGRGVLIGDGSALMAGSVVNSDSSVGENTIINTGATIDHDCKIGNGVHIAPGTTVCGGVTVGDLTLVGAGTVVHPNLTIGVNVIVGAGSTVLENIPDNSRVAGTPARPITQK